MKSLFINGVEEFRIEGNNYYVGNDICLEKVSKEKFIEELNKYDWILTGWCKELKKKYIEMKEMVIC